MAIRKINPTSPGQRGMTKSDYQEITTTTPEKSLLKSLNKTAGLADVLNELGIMLEAHIRKEERVLFPLIQSHCSEEDLQQVYVLLH